MYCYSKVCTKLDLNLNLLIHPTYIWEINFTSSLFQTIVTCLSCDVTFNYQRKAVLCTIFNFLILFIATSVVSGIKCGQVHSKS